MDFIPANNYKDTPEVNVFQDVGRRDEQQDRYAVSRLDAGLLLAVADGHGGYMASSIVAQYVSCIFSEEIQNVSGGKSAGLSSSKVRSVMRKTFQRLIDLTKNLSSGSTLTLAFVETGSARPGFTPATRITVGQLGDSIFAISSKPGSLSLAPMHSVRYKTKDVELIKKAFEKKYGEPCRSSCGYIYSSPMKYQALALTRALGDSIFTLIRKPEIKTYVVDPAQAILLLATDGILKEELSPRIAIKYIMDMIRQGMTVSEINKSLRPLEDNTTILAIRDFG